ncbi:MAG: HDOD domain-containing protein [Planctomycetaceae bacterium]|nr:HDOD domain-containing protein [Planctomycetaceae bacterium]
MTQYRRVDPTHRSSRPHIRVPAEDVRRLQQVLTQEGVTTRRLSEVIETSPELSVAFLKHTNAALFGLSQSVKSVRHAAVLLGLRHMAEFTERLAGAVSPVANAALRPSGRMHETLSGSTRAADRPDAAQSTRPAE